MEMHQHAPFAPLYVRKRRVTENEAADSGGVAAPSEGRE
jgi:hypothetical protein